MTREKADQMQKEAPDGQTAPRDFDALDLSDEEMHVEFINPCCGFNDGGAGAKMLGASGISCKQGSASEKHLWLMDSDNDLRTGCGQSK
jgi:hypothetical protein